MQTARGKSELHKRKAKLALSYQELLEYVPLPLHLPNH